MNQQTLRRVQLTQLEILKEVDRICKKEKIQYWLDAGTFLGAVRHGGFIPWDDDLDIGMLRKDYEHFLQIVEKEIDTKYYVVHWGKDASFHQCFAKIKKRGTIYREVKMDPSTDSGIYIDVFAYDVFPVSKWEQVKQHYPLDLLKRIKQMGGGYKPWKELNGINIKKYILFLPIRFLARIIGTDHRKAIERISQRHNNSNNFTHYQVSGVEQYGRWLIRRECFDRLDEIQFEDAIFPCPSYADKYLSEVYGDYMTPPPVEVRNTGHSIVEVDFGDE